MTKSLLIVSADTKFAQVLQHGLEQEGYRVQITKGKGETVVRADEENSSLAFLDMDLGYRAVLETGQALRMLNPEIRLIVFSRDAVSPELDELHPWMFSPKP
ncbi:MAG TPA: hypothetical protein VFY83_17600, partial [Anaerolineales bacterium]|nr:hypothetical protein [Anaerolineales bacterium]